MFSILNDHYVIVAENDVDIDKGDREPKGPIVFETYLGEESTLTSALHRAAHLKGKYGEVAICKLVQVDPDKEIARQLLDYAQKIGCVEQLKKLISDVTH